MPNDIGHRTIFIFPPGSSKPTHSVEIDARTKKKLQAMNATLTAKVDEQARQIARMQAEFERRLKEPSRTDRRLELFDQRAQNLGMRDGKLRHPLSYSLHTKVSCVEMKRLATGLPVRRISQVGVVFASAMLDELGLGELVSDELLASVAPGRTTVADSLSEVGAYEKTLLHGQLSGISSAWYSADHAATDAPSGGASMPSFVSAWDHNNDKVIRILVESVVTKKGAERSERGGHGAERVERHPQGGAHHGASCCGRRGDGSSKLDGRLSRYWGRAALEAAKASPKEVICEVSLQLNWSH